MSPQPKAPELGGAAPARHERIRRRWEPALEAMRGSDTAKVAGLAGAMIANNALALAATVVFARIIGDYGSLAALVAYLLILTVVGQAMQVATAREGVVGRLGTGEGLLATLRSWTRTMVLFTALVTVCSVLLRHPIADLVGVNHNSWAAAAGLPAACIYLEVSLLRGALQGVGDYKTVGFSLIGEQAARLVFGTVLALVGLGVAGAYLGSLVSYVLMSLYCAWELRRVALVRSSVAASDPISTRATRAAVGLWAHVRSAWVPIAGLAIIQLLQNIDLIAAKHRFSPDLASSYAATAVAAKVLIWVAMGAGLYLVPECSRRYAEGKETRRVLLQTVGVLAVCAVPCLLIFAVASHPLLAIVFGERRATASASLLPLGAAFTVLAATYLAVQYMLALRRRAFLIVLGAVAVAELPLLLQAPRHPAGFAAVVLAVQAVGAILAFALALRSDRGAPPAPEVSLEVTPEVPRERAYDRSAAAVTSKPG
ncbi:MAG: lipopolysaccharide biosynthesis protein [Solirubrobacteraceae bacterium]